MGKSTELERRSRKGTLVKRIDYTTPEMMAETEKLDREIAEEKERQRLAEEQRKEEERQVLEKIKSEAYKALYGKKKAEPVPYKPSRLIDVDTDTTIMNMDSMLKSVKEAVDHIENMLWEIEDFLFRNDKKKRENLKIKKLKRKAQKR